MILTKYLSGEIVKKQAEKAPREENDQHGHNQEKDSILAASTVFAC